MKKWITAGLVLSAAFAASGKVHAAVNYPWCIHGESRGVECVYTSRAQCAESGRGRGFGGQCIRNEFYDPTRGPLGQPLPVRRKLRRHHG
jgi:hypothetical protein